jgi:small-conductance mechanosensitive channel
MSRHRIVGRSASVLVAAALMLVLADGAVGAAPDNPKAGESAIAVLNNRPVVVFRSTLLGHSALERANLAEQRIKKLIGQQIDAKVTTRRMPEGVVVEIDKQPAILITPGDLAPMFGETEEVVVARAVGAIERAIADRREARSLKTMVRAAIYVLAATVVFVAAIWLLHRGFRWARSRLGRLQERWGGKIKVLGLSMLEQSAVAMQWMLRLCYMLIVVFLTYGWLDFCLYQFPQTRPWGESLSQYLFGGLETVGRAVLDWIPDVIIILIVIAVARGLSRLFRMFFLAVEAKRLKLAWLHPEVARPTGRLAQTVLWVFAIIMVYPYLPGSHTDAFKGVTVLLGVIISLGSTSVVNQAASGMVLMYSRAFRAGDFVRLGDIEGTVVSLGILSTRLRTVSREEITIPNAVVVGGTTRNLSRPQRLLEEPPGAVVSVSVTIGYSTPWRKVHELLLTAAARTPGLVKDPRPFVLQKNLSDFYVEYQLNAVAEMAQTRNATLSDLHANLQDVFNEHGEQIMSPHYVADPPEKVWVPRERWHEAPAGRAPEDAVQRKPA